MGIVYFIVAIFATSVGAIAGLGGGVIIKPTLDAIGGYNPFVIGVLASVTVLAMATVSTIRCLSHKIKFSRQLILLTIGAIVGGFVGKELFAIVDNLVDNAWLTTIQAIVMIVLLSIILCKDKLPNWHIKNTPITILVGLVLGTLSAFLGIGGGPINVAVLCMLFAMDTKDAVAGSIFIILFSQIAKLTAISTTIGFGAYDYSVLWYMVPGGILGGLIGSWIKHKVEDKHVDMVFRIVVVGVILLNIYNIFAQQL